MDTTEVSCTIYRIGFADGRAYVGVTSKLRLPPTRQIVVMATGHYFLK